MPSPTTPLNTGLTRHRLSAAVLLAILSGPASFAAADDPAASLFSFGAFGTLGMVHSSEHQADFTSTIFKPNGAGYTHSWSSDVDSRIGAQITANPTAQLSAVVQVIAEQNFDNTYKPHIEWANIKYQVTPDFSLRIGRTVFSSFLFADSRKDGYAIPWVRPPVDLYSLVPISSSDGVDTSYQWHFADAVNTVLATYGNTNLRYPAGGNGDARRQWAITDTVEYGPATVYLTYHEAHLTITQLNTFFDVLRNFGPQGLALANEYDEDNKRLQFFGLGGIYDPSKWFMMGEWGTTNLHSVLGESTAWYVSSGYRLAKITPYFTYGAVKANSNTSDPGLNVSDLPPFLAGPATGLNADLNAILGSIAIQHTMSAGVRWDFMQDVDLKVQCDHTRIGKGSAGTLSQVQPNFRTGGTLNLVTVTIDFVW
jgi:opacity protein-like surface antigen